MFWLLVLALALPVWANFDVSVDESSYDVSDNIKVSWKDDGKAPKISEFKTATILMCGVVAGQLQCPVTLAKGVSITGKTSLSFPLSKVSTQGPPGSYIIQLTGTKSESAYVVTYSGEYFQVKGFTGAGTASPGGIPTGENHDGSAGQSSWTYKTGPLPASLSTVVSSWQIPYTFQSGPERWAPFQITPNSTVTMPLTSATRRFPTSDYTVYKSNIHTLMPYTTNTPSAASTRVLHPNAAPTLSVAYSGSKPSRVTASRNNKNRRRRWAD